MENEYRFFDRDGEELFEKCHDTFMKVQEYVRMMEKECLECRKP